MFVRICYFLAVTLFDLLQAEYCLFLLSTWFVHRLFFLVLLLVQSIIISINYAEITKSIAKCEQVLYNIEKILRKGDEIMDAYTELMQQNQTATSISSIIVAIIGIVALWRVFQKAGEAGWKAIIPFYNAYTFVKIIDANGIKFLLLLIPIVNIVYSIILDVRLAKVFGKSSGFAVGLIFLNPIFMLILAFDSSEYLGPYVKQ